MRATQFGVLLMAALVVTAACDDDDMMGPAPVASVEVAADSSAIPVEGTVQLSATLRDAGGNILTGRTVTWSSSDANLATVDASGLVTAVAAGPVTITATSETVPGTAKVTVLETFTATLLGDNEVPPLTSNAGGTATVIIDGNLLSYTVDVTNIDDVVAAHIHSAAAVGANAGVVVDFMITGVPGNFTGNLVDASMMVDAAVLADIRSGNAYVNVHSLLNPGGEVRGQLFVLGEESFTATLDGASEVPSVTTIATGTATMTVKRNMLSFSVDVADIDDAVAAHIHSAPVGVNGNIIVDFMVTGSTGPGFTGNLVQGTTTIADAVLLEMRSGDTYVNVHTPVNPGGEIRGQIAQQ